MKLFAYFKIENPLKHLAEPLTPEPKPLNSIHKAQPTGSSSSLASKINKLKPYALLDFYL